MRTGRRLMAKPLASMIALMMVITACGSGTATDDTEGSETTAAPSEDASTLEAAKESGIIKLGFVAARPVSYVDEDTGEATGSGLVVADKILGDVGIPELETIFVTFDAMIPGLQTGRWDMSAFPFFITPERCEQVAFTNPVARYTQGAMVTEGNPKDIHSYEDLGKDESIKVAVQAGSAETEWAKEAGVPESNIQSFPEERLAIEAVRQGRADVYLQAKFSLNTASENYDIDGVEVADPFVGPIVDGEEVVAYGGFALRHEDTDLRDAFNAKVAEMLADGSLLEMQSAFGYTADLMPEPDITAEGICPDAPWK